MRRAVRGLVLAFGIFAASFALHIVGGATEQGWLFALAVALIFLSAVCFPVIALQLTGKPRNWATTMFVSIAGGAIGVVLTASAFWAANGRAFAWWQVPLAVVLVAAVNSSLLRLRKGNSVRAPRAVSAR
ncbi:hypothetical protein AYO38_07295 [bacterium SCGC AG-212-C10]|nr:hypothetical protein AYO38_07295 [bacterium SCGC AG-212-C10]